MAKRFIRADDPPADDGREARRRKAIALSDRALKHHDAGRYGKAEPLYRQALKIHDDLAEPHPEYAATLNNLALLLHQTGRFIESEPLLRRLVGICPDVFGEAHFGYATALHSLGELCRDTRRYAEAEPLLRRALAIRHESLGERHDDYVKTLGSLGLVLNKMHRYAEAEQHLKRALDIRQELSGGRPPSYAKALNNLAVLYLETRRYAEAEPLLLRALEIDPADATALNNLGLVYRDTGRHAEAERRFMRALEIDREAGRERHPDHAIAQTNLAISLFRQAQDVRREVFGDEHPAYTAALDRLLSLYREMSRHAGADADAALLEQPALSAMRRLEEKIPGLFVTPKSIRTLERFYLIGREYEGRGAKSQGDVGKKLEIGKNNMSRYFKECNDLLKPFGEVFQRSLTAGNQERISGLTEVGKMVWRLAAEAFRDLGL
jgi:tetratricopeptide (TPR) repeat protein